KIKKEEIQLKTNLDSYFTFIQECLNNFKLIKVTGSEDKQSFKYMNLNQSLYKIGIRKGRLNIFSTTLSQFINYSSYIGIIILGVSKIIAGHLSIGSLVTFNSYSTTLTNSLMRISHLNSELQEVMVSLQRLDEITNSLERESEKSGGIPITQIHSLQMDNLYFQHQKSLDYTFSNLSLLLNENGMYYITGKSGSGKTTLLNIVAGLYTDYDGEVSVNNQEMSTLNLQLYRERICYILQESHLFSASIMENLTLLTEEVTQEEIYSVCIRLNIHETILHLPQSYQTKIGAQGVLLSEGQKQRICIARAILKKADIYLCDEISSSLDKENQYLVTEILHELARNSIVLTVAHHSVDDALETVTEFKGYDSQIRISKVINSSFAAQISQ
ncbi:ATP-binding cassette domain-containing protein, partial [Paenibacillus etheri]|uniref:ATP-binding cassette domain-containing protein n=1 Tax=Paenibacillus etheri TaxID=1306852 RepID=UPI001AE0C057